MMSLYDMVPSFLQICDVEKYIWGSFYIFLKLQAFKVGEILKSTLLPGSD